MELTDAERLFFAARPQALAIYQQVKERLLDKKGVTLTVHKTQISFYARRAFACVWHPPVKRLGEKAVMLSFFLPGAIHSSRLFRQVETKPGQYTSHVVVSETEQLDQEMLVWLEEAYSFACRP